MEGYWALTHTKGSSKGPRPRRATEIQIDDSDCESSEDTGSVRSLLLEGGSNNSLQGFAKRSLEESPITLHEQEHSTLFTLPADALLHSLQFLTDIELMQSLTICRNWRCLLLQEIPRNCIFWQNEVRNLTQTAKVWKDHPGLYKAYFTDAAPPEVRDSFLLCKLRLKKRFDILQRRKLLQSIHHPIPENCQYLGTAGERNYSFPVARALARLSAILHRRGILEALYLLFFYLQGAVLITAFLALNNDISAFGTNILWCFTPTYGITVFFLVIAIVDFIALVFGGELNKLLRQRRWITISEHCTTNRVAVFACVILWCAFLTGGMLKILQETTDQVYIKDMGWVMAASPLMLLGCVVLCVFGWDLYVQKDLYFWLDNGYDFIETSLVQEAELQQSETWNHLITPKLYMMLFFEIFVVLLFARLDKWIPIPYSVVFVPLHLTMVIALIICRKRSPKWLHPYLLWSTGCHIVFFAFLGLDLDLTIVFSIKVDISTLVIPLYVIAIPFWMNLLCPVFHLMGFV